MYNQGGQPPVSGQPFGYNPNFHQQSSQQQQQPGAPYDQQQQHQQQYAQHQAPYDPHQQQQQQHRRHPPPPPPQQQQQQQMPGAAWMNSGDGAAVASAAATMMMSGDATAGQRLFEYQANSISSRWSPGLQAFWNSLRGYFEISHAYVWIKLRTLILPYRKKAWRRSRADQTQPNGYALPVEDDNAPDGYIPMMAYVTFMVVTGYVKGKSGKFTPELLATIASSCAVFQTIEVMLYWAAMYAMGATTSVLDLTCYTGYKYVALCINTVLGFLFGRRAYYAALVWNCFAFSYFMLKTMAQNVPAKTAAVAPPREFVVCGMGFLQGFSIFFLGFVEAA